MIELLLGAVNFAMAALTLFGIFTNGINLHAKVRQAGTLYEEARTMVDTLTADLENMVPYHFPSEITGARLGSFRGDKTGFSLILPAATGLKEVDYSFVCSQAGNI